jgi:DNA-binding transcriptional ArsR family regulator
MFRVLGVGTRIKIIEMLRSKGPLGAKRMAEELGVTPAAVSQHLRVLRQAGLVSSERRGYFIPYRLNPRGLAQCGRQLAEVCVCDCDHEGESVVVRHVKEDAEALLAYKQKLEAELKKVRRRMREVRREPKR